MSVSICGVEQPKRIWLMAYRHAGDICWTADPNPEDADEIEVVEYVRADRPEAVTDELMIELLAQLEEIGGNKAGAFTLRNEGAVGSVFQAKLKALSKVSPLIVGGK